MKHFLEIPYAQEKIGFYIPEKNLQAVLSPAEISHMTDPAAEIEDALQHPIGCKALTEVCAKNSRVLLICDDNTRLTPTELIVPRMIRELKKTGMPGTNIKILVALGTHRPMTEQELTVKFGAKIVAGYQTINHDFRNPEALIDFGQTVNGTPIKVNRLVLEADVIIGIGSIVPHHIPGFSGGAKIIQPGICGEDTTASTHLLSVRTRRNMLGIVENKVRAEMENIAEKINAQYVFNTVLDQKGRVVKALFGNMGAAFRAGIDYSRKVYGISAPGKTPIVLAGSHPCDLEFWQAHKTLYPCDMLVEEGGTMIIVSPCPEGVAVTHPEILQFTDQSPEDIDQQIREGKIKDQVAGALALAWSKVRQHAEVCLVSGGISKEMTGKLGFKYATTIEEALAQAWGKLGVNAQVTVLTHGADTLPLLPE